MLWTGLCGGAFTLGFYALSAIVDHSNWWAARLDGDVVVLTFGEIAVFLAFSGVACYPWLKTMHRGVAHAAIAGSLLAGLLASLLSQSRGAWLAVPFLGVLSAFAVPKGRRFTALAVVATLLMVIVACGFFISKSPLSTRIREASKHLSEWQRAKAVIPFARVGNACGPASQYVEELAREIELFGSASATVHKSADVFSSEINCGHIPYIKFGSRGSKGKSAVVRHFFVNDGVASKSVAFWARGRARLRWMGTSRHVLRINEKTWTSYTWAAPDAGGAIAVIVRPGQHFDFLPILENSYEYLSGFSYSTASRLEMWSAAWKLFVQSPIVGAGLGNIAEASVPLANHEVISPIPTYYDHSHSIYFTAVAQQGLLGVLSLASLIGVPLWYFVRQFMQAGDESSKAASLGGIFLIFAFSIFGLTEAVFNHSSVIAFYMFSVASFSAICEPTGCRMSTELGPPSCYITDNQNRLV
jgi:hypothetical protein